MRKDAIDREGIILQATQDNVYHGWLLVIKAMMEQEDMTVDIVVDTWHSVNRLTAGSRFNERLADETTAMAEKIMGFGLPYPSLSFSHVHSQVELDTLRRKIHKNAIYSAFCIICGGIKALNIFTDEQIRRIFFCADLLEAEIEGGCTTYHDMSSELEKFGIFIQPGDGAARLIVEKDEDGSSETAATL